MTSRQRDLSPCCQSFRERRRTWRRSPAVADSNPDVRTGWECAYSANRRRWGEARRMRFRASSTADESLRPENMKRLLVVENLEKRYEDLGETGTQEVLALQ